MQKKTTFSNLHLSVNKKGFKIKILDKSLSHSALASFAGLSRETVSRIITELKSEGYIATSEFGEIELDVVKTSRHL